VTTLHIKSTFIRKRGNNYNVYIEYIDKEGKIKQRSEAKYTNKKDAEKHLIEIKNSINNNKFVITNNITFVERYKQYIFDESKKLSPATLKFWKSFLKNSIEPFFKDIKLSPTWIINNKSIGATDNNKGISLSSIETAASSAINIDTIKSTIPSWPISLLPINLYIRVIKQ